MNKAINKFLLTGDKFMLVLVDRLLNIVKQFKNLEKQETQNIYTKVN